MADELQPQQRDDTPQQQGGSGNEPTPPQPAKPPLWKMDLRESDHTPIPRPRADDDD